MPESPKFDYDEFYRGGGWVYDLEAEYRFLAYRVMSPLNCPKAGTALEIGCGTGCHAAALQHWFSVVDAIDMSSVAVRKAKAAFKGPRFHRGDALEFVAAAAPATYDLVFARGMSWFHKPLETADQPVALDRLMEGILRALKPDGAFVLQIRTDFRGRIDETGIRHHRFDQLVEFSDRFGGAEFITDWAGLPLRDNKQALKSGRNVILAIRRP
jgi:SAM-dependent methyltransferase